MSGDLRPAVLELSFYFRNRFYYTYGGERDVSLAAITKSGISSDSTQFENMLTIEAELDVTKQVVARRIDSK